MTKKILSFMLFTLTATAVNAQEKQWFQDVKVSGYGMLQYKASDKKGNEQNSFQLRMARVAVDGRTANDFAWKVQAQLNSNATASGTSANIVDLFAEWQRWDFFRVKAGQFKRPFTFENPMHPIAQGFMSYSQNVLKLSGFSDRTGEQSSNGRDIGLQVQGDLLKLLGHNWLHYQVGVFNGEGINVKDRDNRKDIIGGLWIVPIEGLRLGAFGWTGNRVDIGNKNRYALSLEYAGHDWTFRSEYIHNTGYGENDKAGNKADGLYGLAIVPIIKNKLHVKARYDIYRDEANWDVKSVNYEGGIDYMFSKNLLLNIEYARVNEHVRDYNTMNIKRYNYNMVDVQLDFSF